MRFAEVKDQAIPIRLLRSMIERHQIDMVDLKFSDLFGRWQHVTLPISAFTPRTLDKGVAFDG